MRNTMLCVAAMVALAGCSSASGPSFSAWSVDRQDGQQTYRVECSGLLESAETCYRKAREICHDEAVRPLEGAAPLGSTTTDGKPDFRKLIFQCGAPAPQPSTAAPAVVPAAVPVPAPLPTHVTLAGDANFDFNEATLTPAAKAQLDKLVANAQGMSFGTVAIDGYTDGIGSPAYNLRLSQARAWTVANYLKSHGLNAARFDVQGHGRTHPVATNATADGRAQNRRVGITLSGN
ncbi:OmpA family protein [Paraburkholderia sp. Cy-641]|uniref:OmpA family protein n=1 Tax=Paraburkholderia sp. Cy-641 TaxID=2608337 RepID=UPI00141E5262|nr:OmpA family protein [Paraburkholderia sp. Cy-641]NIF81830.1 OmpA family protein [Paraburkholderia sp. Cy-641]